MICWRRLFRLLCFCPTRWIIHRKDWRNEPKNKLNCPTANQYRESKSTANQYREHSCDLWGSLSPPVDKSPQRSFARLTNHPRGRLLDKPPQSSLYTEVFHTTQKKRTAPTCCPPFYHMIITSREAYNPLRLPSPELLLIHVRLTVRSRNGSALQDCSRFFGIARTTCPYLRSSR